MKIILHDDHGGEHDVTELVRSLYGHTTGSMDWGSGFLSTEEELEVLEIGYLAGFNDETIDEAVESSAANLARDRVTAASESARFYSRRYWDTELPKREAFLTGLQAIRDRQVSLRRLTDDVTDFDA